MAKLKIQNKSKIPNPKPKSFLDFEIGIYLVVLVVLEIGI
jgi:uncharacterized metal-binding protein